jgi:hypothetical protein
MDSIRADSTDSIRLDRHTGKNPNAATPAEPTKTQMPLHRQKPECRHTGKTRMPPCTPAKTRMPLHRQKPECRHTSRTNQNPNAVTPAKTRMPPCRQKPECRHTGKTECRHTGKTRMPVLTSGSIPDRPAALTYQKSVLCCLWR